VADRGTSIPGVGGRHLTRRIRQAPLRTPQMHWQPSAVVSAHTAPAARSEQDGSGSDGDERVRLARLQAIRDHLLEV